MRPSSWTRYLLSSICLLGLGCDEAGVAGSRATAALEERATSAQLAGPAAPVAPRAPSSHATAPQASSPQVHESQAPASEASQGPAAQSPLAQESPLQLETRVECEGQTYAARWRVTNRGSSAIYLVTQLPALEGGVQVPAAHAIYRRAEDETLYLTKRLWRVPGAVDPLITMTPFLIRLEPGQVHAGGVRIPPALRESYPYQHGYLKAQIARLVISFGYFDASAEPSASPAHPGLYRVPYSALDQQRYVTSEPAPVRLVVR